MNFVTPKQILNEISSRDAYERFYKDTIDEKIFMELMNGQDKLTPFHKLCLDYIKSETREEYPQMLANFVGEEWPTLDPDKRRELVDMASNGEITPDFQSIRNAFKEVINTKYINSAAAEKDGYAVLYDDGKAKLTVTYTYAANAHYYGGTEWCTASDLYDDNSGWDMFKSYISKTEYDGTQDEIYGSYLQIILHGNNHEGRPVYIMYQIVLDADGIICDAFDQDDNGVSGLVIRRQWNSVSDTQWDQLFSKGIIKPKELLEKTQQCFKHESAFMEKFIQKKVKQLNSEISEKYNKGGYKVALEDSIKRCARGISGFPEKDVYTTGWSFKRTQPDDRYYYAISLLYPTNPKYKEFFGNYADDSFIKIITFVDRKDNDKFIIQQACKGDVRGLIYGVFGIILNDQGFVYAAYNLKTGEKITSPDESDIPMKIWQSYENGYIAFGQVAYKVYNVYTGRLVADKAFNLGILNNGMVHYSKTCEYRPAPENIVTLPSISPQMGESINKMKNINNEIDLL